MRLSVIVSTYNSPDSLVKTLYSLEHQTFRDFDVLIADDGSGPATKAAIDQARATTSLRIKHVWHEDRGFRKNAILNRAIDCSRGDYLVFMDGDILARADLIATHAARARPKQILSGGGHINLPEEMHPYLTRDAIAAGRPFDWRWLVSHGLDPDAKDASEHRCRLTCPPACARLLDMFVPRCPGLRGCNSSAWKVDVVGVNGFDESIDYGVDDRDLGVRLINAGAKSLRLKYSLACLHLAHRRPYADRAAIARNRRLVRQRKAKGTTWIESGFRKSRAAA